MFIEVGRALALIIGGDVEIWQITALSFAVSLTAVLAAIALGLPLTYVLAANPRTAKIGMWVAHSLAALPTVVIGLTLYFLLSASGPLGWTRLLYTRTAMALAQLQVVADAFGLSPLLEREATTLSHGEQRRLALARALVGRPYLLLVDEPEGGLDDEAISVWRACAVRAVEAGEPALVVAAHHPLAFETVPVKEVRL